MLPHTYLMALSIAIRSCQKQIRRSRRVSVKHPDRGKKPHDAVVVGAMDAGGTGSLDQTPASGRATAARDQDHLPPDPVPDGPRNIQDVPASNEAGSGKWLPLLFLHVDDAEHTVLRCKRWVVRRLEMLRLLGRVAEPEPEDV